MSHRVVCPLAQDISQRMPRAEAEVIFNTVVLAARAAAAEVRSYFSPVNHTHVNVHRATCNACAMLYFSPAALSSCDAQVGCEVVEALCAGSYRRGNSTCGDVDVLLCLPNRDACKRVLAAVVRRLGATQCHRHTPTSATTSLTGAHISPHHCACE